MSAQLPPWLDVTPQSFAAAAEAGQRFGIEREQMANQLQMEQARLQQSKQQFDTDAAIKQHQFQISKDESDRQFAMQQQQHQLDMAMKQNQWQMAAKQFQTKAMATQKFQQLVASGVDPSDAMLQVGPMMGESGSAMAAAYRDKQSQRMASAPIEFTTDPETGERVATLGGRVYPLKGVKKEKADIPEWMQKARAAYVSNLVKDGAKPEEVQANLKSWEKMVGYPGSEDNSTGAGSAPPDGTIMKKDGKVYVMKDGRPVPQDGSSTETAKDRPKAELPVALGSSVGGEDVVVPDKPKIAAVALPKKGDLKGFFKNGDLRAPGSHGSFYLDKNNRIQWKSDLFSMEGGITVKPTKRELDWLKELIGSQQ